MAPDELYPSSTEMSKTPSMKRSASSQSLSMALPPLKLPRKAKPAQSKELKDPSPQVEALQDTEGIDVNLL